MKTLLELYRSHVGFVSDKWESYLRCYDELLSPWRDQPISLLEIGVQNGGSLDVWSRYFPNAVHLIGCDINPDCAKLSYADPRVKVVVGDANGEAARTQILGTQTAFDIIVDDGSHRSSDIVKSFALYFPQLRDGGLFIAEDLHCSYWRQFEGGLFDQLSSISFFKRLVDIVNFEHWGYEASRASILEEFAAKYGVTIGDELLAHIHSVEFRNSLCILRKRPPAENLLGPRTIAGVTELVVQGHLPLFGSAARAIRQDPNAMPRDPIAIEKSLRQVEGELQDLRK
jgi:hypothetical protein